MHSCGTLRRCCSRWYVASQNGTTGLVGGFLRRHRHLGSSGTGAEAAGVCQRDDATRLRCADDEFNSGAPSRVQHTQQCAATREAEEVLRFASTRLITNHFGDVRHSSLASCWQAVCSTQGEARETRASVVGRPPFHSFAAPAVRGYGEVLTGCLKFP